jgi:predicted DNA-binding protein (MmcQ/YjbR family)
MHLEEIRSYCLSKKGVTECFPFDQQTLVFKVLNKMFLLTDIDANPVSVNLKCNPEYAIELREKYDCIQPGYHMNKKLWNTVILNGELSNHEFYKLVDHSYNEVVAKLSKKTQEELTKL